MRIPCPLCGLREHGEFTYLGDARLMYRPETTGDDVSGAFYDYVYLRDNPAGEHRELWSHDAGCRSWLVVTRDTRNHAIGIVERAQDVAARGTGRPPEGAGA